MDFEIARALRGFSQGCGLLYHIANLACDWLYELRVSLAPLQPHHSLLGKPY